MLSSTGGERILPRCLRFLWFGSFTAGGGGRCGLSGTVLDRWIDGILVDGMKVGLLPTHLSHI